MSSPQLCIQYPFHWLDYMEMNSVVVDPLSNEMIWECFETNAVENASITQQSRKESS